MSEETPVRNRRAFATGGTRCRARCASVAVRTQTYFICSVIWFLTFLKELYSNQSSRSALNYFFCRFERITNALFNIKIRANCSDYSKCRSNFTSFWLHLSWRQSCHTYLWQNSLKFIIHKSKDIIRIDSFKSNIFLCYQLEM